MDGAGDDPLVGKEIANGRYFVVNVLGRGGMGTVYTALQRPVDRKVALKIIHRELAGNPEIVARFLEEMRMTAAIEHPHTVRVYDFGDIEGQPFLTTEFLAGRSLRDEMLRTGKFSQERIATITNQIAKALRAANVRGVVHRDLKPENIMLLDLDGETDYVKVLDFGIARSLHKTTGFRTGTGALLGTPAYMSPEQCEGKRVDGRSDLYTLGLIAYELATGTLPFPMSDSVPQLLISHVSQPPADIRARAPQIGEPLAALVMSLLAKSPDQRPASAEAVIAALEPILPATRPSAAATAATEMRPSQATAALPAKAAHTLDPPVPPTIPPRPKRSPLVPMLVGLVVAAAGGGWWLFGRAKPAADDTVRVAGDPPFADACVAADPTGRALFEAARAPGMPEPQLLAGAEQLVARCPSSAHARVLLGKTLTRLGQDEAAESHLRKAVTLDPALVVARFNLAVVLLKRDRHAQAIPFLDGVLKDEPAHASAHLVRGQARLKNNDARGAAEDLEQQTRLVPNSGPAWLLLAQARRSLGDEEGARQAAAKATEGAR